MDLLFQISFTRHFSVSFQLKYQIRKYLNSLLLKKRYAFLIQSQSQYIGNWFYDLCLFSFDDKCFEQANNQIIVLSHFFNDSLHNISPFSSMNLIEQMLWLLTRLFQQLSL